MFSSRSSMFSGITLKPLIHFNLLFCEWYKVCIQFPSYTCKYLIMPAPFIEETVFSTLSVLGCLVILVDCIWLGLFQSPCLSPLVYLPVVNASTVLF